MKSFQEPLVTIKAGLIGAPLNRSLSPRLFKLFNERLGTAFRYSILETPEPALGRTLEKIKALGWSGFNVTLPLKEKIIPFLDALAPEAADIGAVNAVRIRNGALTGHNTDAFAVKLSLKEAGCLPRGRACVIWGAGGAARAAAWVLAGGGAASVSIRCRSRSRGAALVKHFSGLFPGVSFDTGTFASASRGASVFVNATPLGMYAPMRAELRAGGAPGSFYLDFAYPHSPARGHGLRLTPFLEGRSGTVIPGIDLLIYQALKSAELFGGGRRGAGIMAELKNNIRAGLE